MTNPDDARRERDDLDAIGELVRLAGRRPAPDPAQVSRARAEAHREWARVTARRRWRRSLWSVAGAAVAAGVLFAAGGWLRQWSAVVPGAEIASVHTVAGSIRITSSGESPRTATQAGERIRVGDRIETMAAGRAALAMPGGLSLRLDRATAAVLERDDRLALVAGAIYVDAAPGVSHSVLHINTPFGVVRHTGTQFEVRLDRSTLTVRVREGAVAVEASGARWTSQAGEAVVVTRSAAPRRSVISRSGPEWNWVSALAQPFRLEGETVPAFLSWVSREQGWSWEYADPSLRARVDRIVLHGSIEGLTPEEALAVLPTAGLSARRQGDRLIVSIAAR